MCALDQPMYITHPHHHHQVTGFPRAAFWVSSSAVDASLFLYLLCLDARGTAHYITEGTLRVSSRKLLQQQQDPSTESPSVQDFPGLPRHTFRRADAQFLEPGGTPVEVRGCMCKRGSLSFV